MNIPQQSVVSRSAVFSGRTLSEEEFDLLALEVVIAPMKLDVIAQHHHHGQFTDEKVVDVKRT